MESNDLSFLPEDFRDRNMRYRLTAAAIAVLAVFAVATATAFHVAERSLQHVKRHNAEVTRAFTRAVLRGERSAAIRNENEKLVERARRICLLASGIPTSKILADLTKAVPPTLALTSLSVQSIPRPPSANLVATAFDIKKAALESKRRTGGDALPDVSPSDFVVKLSGDADTNAAVSQFCEKLARSSLFQNVRLVSSEICAAGGNEKAATRRFQIEAMLNPSAACPNATTDSITASVVDPDGSPSKEKP